MTQWSYPVVQKIADLAKSECAFVNSLVVMGTCGDLEICVPKTRNIGSDIDILLLIDESTDLGKAVEITKAAIQRSEMFDVLLVLTHNGKLVVYLSEGFLKVDLGFAHGLNDYARYLRGSEACHIYWTRENQSKVPTQQELTTLMSKKAVDILPGIFKDSYRDFVQNRPAFFEHDCCSINNNVPEYKMKHQQESFLEYIELLCKSIARQDAYRVEFYVFLLRHALVTMEQIRSGITEHLYLPKRAFTTCPSVAERLVLGHGNKLLAMGLELPKSYFEAYLVAAGVSNSNELKRWFSAVQKYYFG